MPLLHVRWEKTLFGMLYHTPRAAMFQAYLAKAPATHASVYGELFYARTEAELASFTYSHNPLNGLTRTHITLWSGHDEDVVYKLDGRRQLVTFEYALTHASKPCDWACIPRAVKDALREKSDDHVILAKCSPKE